MLKAMKKGGIAVAGALILVLAGVFLGGTIFRNSSSSKISSDLIAGNLTAISEYASLEYRYTNVGKFEDQGDFYGWKVPLTTKSFLITYDGVMKMGIQGEDIAVTERGNQILVTLPSAKILSHEIKENSVQVFDQTQNIFNQIGIQDYTNFAADRKKDMEEKVIKEGLLKQAEERAKQQLELFLEKTVRPDREYKVQQSSH